MNWGQDTGSGAEPQPGGGRWYISSAYQCLHLLVLYNVCIPRRSNIAQQLEATTRDRDEAVARIHELESQVDIIKH